MPYQTIQQPPQADTQVSAQTAASQEKEYSIAQFRRDYSTIFHSKVLPVLGQFEGERKKRLYQAIAASAALVILGLTVLVFAWVKDVNTKNLQWFLICSAWIAWSSIQKPFERKIKKLIMPVLMQAFPGFFWQETPPVTDADIKRAKIFNIPDGLKATFDDCFVGTYRNVTVHISECDYTIRTNNSDETVFEGALVRIKMNKNFEGLTVIRPKKAPKKDNYKDLKKIGLEEVKLEDPVFEKLYTVYSTDQIESRYLLTTAFMERMNNIQKAFNADCCFCSFYDKYMYLGLHTGCDLFALGRLTRPVDDTDEFTGLLNEFTSVLELVDHFKLDKKLGL